MLRGVQFGEFNTATDWDLILNSINIADPKPKTNYVSVPGRSGDLDLTEGLTGEVEYENRGASFTFLLTNGSHLDREELIGTITNLMHGRKFTCIIPDKSEYYLSGRWSVSESKNDKAYGSITLEGNCDPWFYANNETIKAYTLTGAKQDIILANKGVKTLIPEITVTGSVKLTYGDISEALSDGTYKLVNLKIKRGGISLSVEGTGTVTFTYREAVLR